MKALIFAAGLGTRLKPLTDTCPKALVHVAGKPLLAHLLERMAKAGFHEIVINVHHFAEQIIEYVNGHPIEGVRVSISDEREKLLETGGGIRKAASCFIDDGRPFLVHNVDIFSNLDLHGFYSSHADAQGVTLLVSQRKTSRYLLFDPRDNRLKGWTNIQTGEVRSPYPHLCVDECVPYAFAGIHMFSPSLLPYMEKWDERFSIIDFYLSIADKVPVYGAVHPDLQLLDVGKPETLLQAEAFIR